MMPLTLQTQWKAKEKQWFFMVFTKSIFSLFFLPWHIFSDTFHLFSAPRASFGLPWAPLGAIWGSLWASLGPLWHSLASLWRCLGAPWSKFWPLGTPRAPSGTIFHGISWIFMNSGEYSWYFMHLFSHIFLKNLLKFSVVFPIPPSISKASMPQSPRAT